MATEAQVPRRPVSLNVIAYIRYIPHLHHRSAGEERRKEEQKKRR